MSSRAKSAWEGQKKYSSTKLGPVLDGDTNCVTRVVCQQLSPSKGRKTFATSEPLSPLAVPL
jgi:hypothetical protein